MSYLEAIEKNMKHFYELNRFMEEHGWPMFGGSYLINGQNLNYDPTTFEKQKLLYDKVKGLDNGSILEVGVYAGHSLLIMLMANETVKICAIDPCYEFTEPCVEYLNTHFGNRIHFKKGLSQRVLPDLSDKYDLIHIDGGHAVEVIEHDVTYCMNLLKEDGIVVLDDYDGIEIVMKEWIDERLEVVEVANCRNPNAICKLWKFSN